MKRKKNRFLFFSFYQEPQQIQKSESMAYNQMVFTCFDYLSVHCSYLLYLNYYSIYLMGCRFFCGRFIYVHAEFINNHCWNFNVSVYAIFIKEYFPHIESNTIRLALINGYTNYLFTLHWTSTYWSINKKKQKKNPKSNKVHFLNMLNFKKVQT